MSSGPPPGWQPTRAPWSAAGPGGGDGLPQAPTRAPWADGASTGPRPSSPPPPPRSTLPSPSHLTPVHHAPTVPASCSAADPPPAWPPALPPGYVPGPPARKRIIDAAGLAAWRAAPSYRALIAFVLHLNAAVKGVRTGAAPPAAPPLSRGGAALVAGLARLAALVDDTPPAAAALRYGNPAFRDWHARASEKAPGLLAGVLGPASPAGLAEELAPYLTDALGNAARIDYGTGHEAAFAALLFCLARVPGCLEPSDAAGLVVVVFAAYVKLMRKVQTTYWLEPAGSHGVWGLDDYSFLPFLWGSSQLCGGDDDVPRPSAIVNDTTLAVYADAYLYLDAVRFVRSVKKGPLAETSPMLCDIAATVPTWGRVNAGMARMWQAECLGKVPIMQHFLFCGALPFTSGLEGGVREEEEEEEEGGAAAEELERE